MLIYLILDDTIDTLFQLMDQLIPPYVICLIVDEYEYLENLENEKTREFIAKSNEETDRVLGGRANEVYPSLLSIFREPQILDMFAYSEDEPALLLYGESNKLLLGSKVLYTPPEGYVLSSIWKVYNSDEIGVSIGRKGSDKLTTLLISVEGGIKELGQFVSSPFYFNGDLCYVQSYRESAPPDGGEFPSERIFCGKEIVYGRDLGPGEFVEPKVFGSVLTVVKSRGWRFSELYVGEDFNSLRKIDEGEVLSVIAYTDQLIYMKNNTIKLGEKSINSNFPIINATAGKDFLAINVIKDYRTQILYYDINGINTNEETYDNVIFIDSNGSSLFLGETSFKFKYKVHKKTVEKGQVQRTKTIMEYGNYNINVTDVYIKGDVLLHGFLLSKSPKSKGVIVYGYGGFRISLLPSFPSYLRPLLDGGFSVLITNLRGGYEDGEEWHKQGMLLNKKNVFKDFESFTKLVKEFGGKTVAMGGSSGGLLVGAVANRSPELIDCAVIIHPVLDMIRYPELYVGKYWIDEYGDPKDPKYRDYLLSYSPYHNLRPRLPKTLVVTGTFDDRVHPAHTLKYVAKSKALGNDTMLFVNDSGHSIADPESEAREFSVIVSFVEQCFSNS